MVDEAKAFCPACGNAFVEEEQRAVPSNFEAMDSTVQFGQTMYNQMLSDMGLNVAKPASAPEKRIEVIVPVAAAAAPAPAVKPVVKPTVAPAKASGYMKWIILGAVIVAMGVIVVLVAAVALYWFWLRTN